MRKANTFIRVRMGSCGLTKKIAGFDSVLITLTMTSLLQSPS
jgi:hypothetical protein